MSRRTQESSTSLTTPAPVVHKKRRVSFKFSSGLRAIIQSYFARKGTVQARLHSLVFFFGRGRKREKEFTRDFLKSVTATLLAGRPVLVSSTCDVIGPFPGGCNELDGCGSCELISSSRLLAVSLCESCCFSHSCKRRSLAILICSCKYSPPPSPQASPVKEILLNKNNSRLGCTYSC